MDKAKKDEAKKKAKLPRFGDVVCWFAIKAAAAAICQRLSGGGERDKLQVGKTYPVSLRVTGTANGTAIDEQITGRLARDEDAKVSNAPRACVLLAEALSCLQEPERGKVAERIKKGTARASDECKALAEAVLAARRTDGTRAGGVRLVPVA